MASLKHSSFQEDLTAAFQYVKGACKKDRERLFTRLVVVGQGAMILN